MKYIKFCIIYVDIFSALSLRNGPIQEEVFFFFFLSDSLTMHCVWKNKTFILISLQRKKEKKTNSKKDKQA